MISHIETGVVNYLRSFLNDYGISITFKYDEKLDTIAEFRRSPKLRIEQNSLYTDIINGLSDTLKSTEKLGQDKYYHNLGLFNRSPLTRNEDIGNNHSLGMTTYTSNIEAVCRSVINIKFSMSIKILSDSYEMTDLIELLYVSKLANQTHTLKVDYEFDIDGDNKIEDVPYSLAFSQLESIDRMMNSNLRELSFSIDVSGPTFLPFTTDAPIIKIIEVHYHLYNRTESIKYTNATKLNEESVTQITYRTLSETRLKRIESKFSDKIRSKLLDLNTNLDVITPPELATNTRKDKNDQNQSNQ